MNESPFRSVHHICIVVRDLDRSVSYYERAGVGPWHDFPSLAAFKEFRGVDRDAFLGLRYRFANLANVQLQLYQPGDADTPQKRFLEERGEGVFHIGFSVADCDEGEREAAERGLGVLLGARLPGKGGFTYFDTRDAGAGTVLQVRSLKT